MIYNVVPYHQNETMAAVTIGSRYDTSTKTFYINVNKNLQMVFF